MSVAMSSVNLNRQKKLNAQMNEVMDDFDRFEYFFASHWKQIVIAAVLLVVAVAVIVGIQYYSRSSRMQAALAYSSAADAPALEKAIAQYGNAPASVYIQLSALYLDKKEYAKAREQLAIAASDDSAPELQYRARINLAYVDELEGKYADAAKNFADFAKSVRTPGSAAYAAEAYVNAGRLYTLAGKTADAKSTLEAAKRFIQTAPAEDRAGLQNYAGQINSMLANLPQAVKTK